MIDFKHISVLKEESIDGLNIKPDGIYVDCTTGGAGHSFEIVKQLTTGRLICFDKDTDALTFAKEKLKDYLVEHREIAKNQSNVSNTTHISPEWACEITGMEEKDIREMFKDLNLNVIKKKALYETEEVLEKIKSMNK